MSEHTPGPWVTCPITTDKTCTVCVVSKNTQVISICGDPTYANAAEANANLIASAPNLLEALEAMLEECDPMKLNCGEPWCSARAAISSARGEA